MHNPTRILAILAALGLAIYAFYPKHIAPDAPVKAAATPANGITGGTTSAAAERGDSKPAHGHPASETAGIAPPAPAAQLAPITQGASDVVDDVPVGAEVSEDGTASAEASARQ